MRRKKISQATSERCLLTEVAPYETPVLYSNWGAYNFMLFLKGSTVPRYLASIFDEKKGNSIPFKYRIRKDAHSLRTLFVLHPKSSGPIVSLYQKYDYQIIKLCRRSTISLRCPSRVAKFFTLGRGRGGPSKFVEEITAESAYASSYFAYSQFSHLHKFFESDEYADLEKKYAFMLHLDISKCFPSIYTHSISWAARGKTYAKARLTRPRHSAPKSFDEVFDKVMQDLNYRETHGIAIGPELSRIFAEIILQKVDCCLLQSAARKGLKEGPDYRCYRYIDDYYLFFNDDHKQETWTKCLKHELEKFRLYLSTEKSTRSERPFITPISMVKIALSEYLRGLNSRLSVLKMSGTQNEVNRLRAILKTNPVSVSHISSFALSSIERLIWQLDSKAPNYADQIYVLLELSCHILRMDIRVPCCFKWMSIAIVIRQRMTKLTPPNQQRVKDKILHELKGAIDDAFELGALIEGGNLLIAGADFFGDELVSKELVLRIIERCKADHSDEYSREKRISYFDTVCLLYAVRDHSALKPLKDQILAGANASILSHEPLSYSETAHLLLDLISCPWLDDAEKRNLTTSAFTASKLTPAPLEIKEFVDFAGKQTWFFNWNKGNRLTLHLKKKQLLLSY
jgi:hypothetical protein